MAINVAILAVVCSVHPVPELNQEPRGCTEMTITDSRYVEDLTMYGCMGYQGQSTVLKWVEEHALYRTWYIKGWRCRFGNKAPSWQNET